MRRLGSTCLVILFFAVIASCAHYTTENRPDRENMIYAPADVVWEKALETLRLENIKIVWTKEAELKVYADQPDFFTGDGAEILIHLLPRDPRQTVIHITAKTGSQIVGWGHHQMLVESLYQKIKNASEIALYTESKDEKQL